MQSLSGRHDDRGSRHQAAALFLGLCVAFLALVAPGHAQEPSSPPSADGPVLVLDIQGAIGPATAGYLRHALEVAGERQATLIVLRMDTPGGLASAMRDMIRDLLASPIPVATYVAPSGARAASAGTYILYASHLAAMAPGTNLGAATPVQLGGGSPFGGDPGGQEPEEEKASQPQDASTAKAVNDAVAYIRGLAELRGRNADWAEQAVREAASLPAGAALEQGVIDLVATDLGDLLAKADGRKVRIAGQELTLRTAGLETVPLEPDWRARLLAVISDPNIAYILMLIGIYGIIFELMNPGTLVPGVIGAVALVVGLYALNLLPIDYAGAGLVLLGIALMAAEAFQPSFGILGVGGAVAFALGSLFMFDEVPGFELSLTVVLLATAVSALLLAVILAAALRAQRQEVVIGDPAMTGASGRVLNWSGSSGHVLVRGEQWSARSVAPLRPGASVRVSSREGLVLLVEPTED